MVTVREDYDLTGSNTFRMKVRCARFVEYDKASDLSDLNFDSLPQPVFHIGAGSNLLFTGDFPGTVLHSRINFIKYADLGLPEVPVMVGSGVVFDDFVAQVCGHGLWGAENLSMIPGEVGAAAVQNIGAYGSEVADIISGVVCFDLRTRSKVSFKASECRYGYRDSMFKDPENKGRYIVTSVLFRLSRNAGPKLDYKGVREALENCGEITPTAVREAVMALRRTKLPDPAETGSAGSFFKNPVVTAAHFAEIASGFDTVPHYILDSGFVKVPAAWMIDQCGFKGASHGGAGVWDRQPLVLVNRSGDAAPEEIMELEARIVTAVLERFGVELQAEVEHI
ncbi:MAG: UDP-N-acetylmuramate dehydrogenase [Bacteroidales bacterium]|nr:UDP-N-acetylmuramate dehydrogenase [Bacteroidales bacterium]